jgi:hypothetical protein
MAQATIATQIHQSFDVHCDFTTQVTFNKVISVNRLTNLDHFRIGQLVHAPLRSNSHFFADFCGLFIPNPMDIGERNKHSLIRGNIHTSYTSHVLLLPKGIAVTVPQRKTRTLSPKYRSFLLFSRENPMVCFGAAVALAGIIGFLPSRSTA